MLPYPEPVTHADTPACDTSRTHFDRSECADSHAEPRGWHGATHFDDAPIASGKHDVDRKLHEERVYAAAGCNHERRARGQTVAAEQSFFPGRGIKRHFYFGSDGNIAPLNVQSKGRRRSFQQRLEKVATHGKIIGAIRRFAVPSRPAVQKLTSTRIRTQLHQLVVGGIADDGGWPYYAGGTSRLEPTSWGVFALSVAAAPASRPFIARARTFLRSCQRADGLLIEPHMSAPNFGWNGLALLADLAADRSSNRWRESLANALIAARGISVEDSGSPLRQNNRLQAWPWTEGTFSWIEPTAVCVLALKRAYGSVTTARTRIAEAESMMFDRVCDGGGWNYGNAQVFGQDLRPYVPTTALALLALQDRREHPAVEKSVAWLVAHGTSEPSTMALSLATLCLGAWGASVEESRGMLERRLASDGPPRNIHLAALALAALSAGSVAALRVG